MEKQNIESLFQLFKIETLQQQTMRENIFLRILSLKNSQQYTIETAKNHLIYQEVLKSIYTKNKEINSTISLKYFEKKIQDYISKCISDEKIDKLSELEKLLKQLEEMPIVEYTVLKPIHGIKLNKDEILDFGLIKVIDYNNEKHEKYIRLKAGGLNKMTLWGPHPSDYYVMTVVDARESEHAYELSESIFYNFEYFLKFSLGRPLKEGEYIGILNVSYLLPKTGILLERDGSVTSKHENTGITTFIDIDNDYFFSKDSCNDKLWNLLLYTASGENSKFKNKLIQAIQWVGKAFSEIDLSMAMLQYTMALESIFSNLEKGIITPSITANIAESIALIVGKNYDDRIELEKTVKDIYSTRSAISHGSKKAISELDTIIASKICIVTIRQFLQDPELEKIETPEKFLEILKRKKYNSDQVV